jgi:hypothetical protein
MRKYTLQKPGIRPPALRPVSAAKHAADGGCPDGGWKPLTKEQKMRLAILARKAAAVKELAFDNQQMNAWRQEVSIRACGLRISEASQCHWADLKSAFEDLAGDSVAAYQTQLRDGDNKRRVALWKLTQALDAKGLQMGYAAAICRAQFKCSIEDASAKQLWNLFYTITNRKRKA